MEKIQKFENCIIENTQDVYGGRDKVYYDTPGECGCHRDKDVYNKCGDLIKIVTAVESWFHRDRPDVN
ncbi:MAG: hypothetical protein ACEPOV_05245 [Hyphomicrobiales bacterium]